MKHKNMDNFQAVVAPNAQPSSVCDCLIKVDSEGIIHSHHEPTCEYGILRAAFERAVWRWAAVISKQEASEAVDAYIKDYLDEKRGAGNEHTE